MQDRDWMGTAAAVTALAMTAGVWLWPEAETPRPAPSNRAVHAPALDEPTGDDMVRWRAEARRWDGLGETVQLSSAQAPGTVQPMLR